MSLRARLLLLVVLAVIPVVGIEIYGDIQLRATQQDQVRQEAQRLLSLVAAEQERIDEGARQLLVAFSAARSVRTGDWDACSAMAALIRPQLEGYTNISVTARDGSLLCSALPPTARQTQRASIFPGVTAGGGLFVGHYHVARTSGRKLITFALPILDDAGAVVAAARATMDLAWLARHFADRFTSANMTLLIADRTGTVLVRLPDNDKWAGKFIGDRFLPLLRADSGGVVDMPGIDGVERFSAYSPLASEPKGLFLAVGLAKAPYLAPIDDASRREAMLISASFALALTAAWLAGRAFIRRPIESLLATTRRWQAGDYAARCALADRSSEIGRLGRAFDEMAESLEGRERMRRVAEASLERLNAELDQRVKDEVAAREKAQAALTQAQKIEAVGQLTSGIAHDFNNLLAAVLGSLEMLRPRIAEARGRQLLEGAVRAATRGAKLTEQLLAFSRRRHSEPEPLDLNDLIQGMSNLLARSLGPAIVVSRSLAPELWPVLADPSQIEIALLNLAVNARDAMPMGGTLLIETGNLPAGHKRLPDGLAGDFVIVAVSDTGSGMTEAVKARAFEPFYTTKEIGKGTGLGLSMVYGVVRQSGGTAAIDSDYGKGTTVALFLPRSWARPAQASAELPAAAPVSASPQGWVLLVDDDPDVREFAAGALVDSGLGVTAVEGGQAALDLIEISAPVDIMIVDYAMPGLNGAEVITRARRLRPNLPAILLTGYAEGGLAQDLPPDVPLLRKPFRVAELLARIGTALIGDGSVEASTNVHSLPASRKRE